MPKYPYSLERRVKEFVEWELEHFPENQRELDSLKLDMIPSAIPKYEAREGGSSFDSEARPTEEIALRIATSPAIDHLERSVYAVERVTAGLDRADKMLIELHYWRRSHSIESAAAVIHMGTTTAYEHVNSILTLIAREMGYVNIE